MRNNKAKKDREVTKAKKDIKEWLSVLEQICPHLSSGLAITYKNLDFIAKRANKKSRRKATLTPKN